MRFSSVRIGVFGALNDVRVELRPGLNLVVGENEAGKSTLFAALRHTMLTPSRLTPARLQRELGRHFPRPDGNELECELTIDASGTTTLFKRWGSDPRAVLTDPDGSRVTGADVDSRIESMLPVRPGTWASIFLTDQAQLDETIERLASAVESRDEVAAVLRRARAETGGILVEAFERALAERIKQVFGRWDRERDRPEGGRGIDRPWSVGVGEVLHAWYEAERTRAELAETVRAERELDEATTLLEERASALRDAEDFVASHRLAYESLSRLQALDAEIATLSETLDDLRSAIRRWPVLEEDLRRVAEELTQVETEIAGAEAGLSRSADRRARSERRATYRRARAAQNEIEDARRRLDAASPVDEQALSQLRSSERVCADLRTRLSAGTIRVRVTALEDATVRLARDDENGEESRLAAGKSEHLEAHRRILIETDSLTIEAETGDEPYSELQARLRDAEVAAQQAAVTLGTSSAEEAAARKSERASLERELVTAKRRMDETLGDTPFEALRDEFESGEAGSADGLGKADGADPGRDEAGAATRHGEPGAADHDETWWSRAVAEARQRLGAAQAEQRALRREEAVLVGRYGTQESLEDRLAEIKTRLSVLTQQRAATAVIPEGFDTAEAFLDRYRALEATLGSLRGEHHEARIRQADLLARLPERTGEEARAASQDAEREYQRVRRRAEALARLEAASAAARAEQEEDPFEPFARTVAGYLAIASDRAYSVLPSADPLQPERFVRKGGPELDYELLSQGTRDIVALSLRLALAETALGEHEAPLLLDDPLVDMDPDRRVSAARAIAAYAATRQVVLFTCHPDHASLFAGGHLLKMGRG